LFSMHSRISEHPSKSRSDALEQGRASFRSQAWASAFSQLAAADAEEPLGPDDLVLLAQSALLTGREAEGGDLLSRAHQAFLGAGEVQRAVRCAFWLGFTLLVGGESAKAGGWLSRAGRLLEGQPDCVDKGYLLLPEGYRLFHAGKPERAHALFVQAADMGEKFHERELITLALQGQGRSLIRQGQIERGVNLLDEAMVAVTAGEVSPLTAGGVYCSVLEACGEICDLQRAQEWTSALDRWCASQPDLVPYRGHCLVRRAELLQLHGAWPDALEGAQRASEWLLHPAPKPGAGSAFYQMGEVYRLRGKFAEAEEAYRQASQWYRNPGSGLALLRLVQGKVAEAETAIRRALEEEQRPGPRARILDAYVEIMLAAGDVAAARGASNQLAEIAGRRNTPFLRALALRATGSVLLAEGDARGALAALRQSWQLWCDLQAPYEAARVRYLMALAFNRLGEEHNAAVELEAAGETFLRLGASVDLARVDVLLCREAPKGAGPLTDRELEVLRLVASGMTNRSIAGKLHISEKTVARHLSNIFMKLDLSSRTAAAAYAYDHNLV